MASKHPSNVANCSNCCLTHESAPCSSSCLCSFRCLYLCGPYCCSARYSAHRRTTDYLCATFWPNDAFNRPFHTQLIVNKIRKSQIELDAVAWLNDGYAVAFNRIVSSLTIEGRKKDLPVELSLKMFESETPLTIFVLSLPFSCYWWLLEPPLLSTIQVEKMKVRLDEIILSKRTSYKQVSFENAGCFCLSN